MVSYWCQFVPPWPRPLNALMPKLGMPVVLEGHVGVEAGDAEGRAGALDAVHPEIVQRVHVHPVVADPEIVVEVRPPASACTSRASSC